MIIKKLDIPWDLKLERYLFWRGGLSGEDKRQYLNDEKGFEGELKFFKMLKDLPASNSLILAGLLLRRNGRLFQIDFIIILQNKIYLIDVKNFEGDFYIERDRWYSFSGTEIDNPVYQLQRAEAQLRQLLQSHGVKLLIESRVVFINSAFSLFQASKNLPIILPTQLDRFIKNLMMIISRPGKAQMELAKKLASWHITKSPFSHVPDYTFEALKKGAYCASCHTFSLKLISRQLVCQRCGCIETLESAVMRFVEELHALFPERNITVSAIAEWCGLDVDSRRILRILQKNLTMVNNGRYTYYVFPK